MPSLCVSSFNTSITADGNSDSSSESVMSVSSQRREEVLRRPKFHRAFVPQDEWGEKYKACRICQPAGMGSVCSTHCLIGEEGVNHGSNDPFGFQCNSAYSS